MPAEAGSAVGDCDSCGRASDDLGPVRRMWVHPEPVVDDDVERWCASCRSQYPHEPQ